MNDLELLQLLKKSLRQYFKMDNYCGMCAVIQYLTCSGLINVDEASRLFKLIDNNNDHPVYDKLTAYYFKPGLVRPRLRYLKTLINKHNEKISPIPRLINKYFGV